VFQKVTPRTSHNNTAASIGQITIHNILN